MGLFKAISRGVRTIGRASGNVISDTVGLHARALKTAAPAIGMAAYGVSAGFSGNPYAATVASGTQSRSYRQPSQQYSTPMQYIQPPPWQPTPIPAMYSAPYYGARTSQQSMMYTYGQTRQPVYYSNYNPVISYFSPYRRSPWQY